MFPRAGSLRPVADRAHPGVPDSRGSAYEAAGSVKRWAGGSAGGFAKLALDLERIFGCCLFNVFLHIIAFFFRAFISVFVVERSNAYTTAEFHIL